MRLRVLICFLLVVIGQAAFSAASPLNSITSQLLQTYVSYLSADALEGRLTGSTGEKIATQYIAMQFKRLGLEPAGDDGTYFQTFYFIKGESIQQGRNVLAKLKVNSESKQLIIVGAHVDHLGHGEWLGGHNPVNTIYPGADDNASGVASVLAVATELSKLKASGKLHGHNDIIFAAWSGEEVGILGSSSFVKNYVSAAQKQSALPVINAALNLDMVGHLKKNLVLQGIGSSHDWLKVIKNSHPTISFITQDDPYLPTDSTAFYLQGIPTINFFTGADEHYHSTSDKPETLNYVGMRSIDAFIVNLICALENEQGIMEYHQIPMQSNALQRQFNVYLGTIPDYAGIVATGVKLAGVANKSPAEQAGLKTNDVVVELAGKRVHDIYSYTYILNTLQSGKPAKMVVIRDGIKKVVTIVPKNRS